MGGGTAMEAAAASTAAASTAAAAAEEEQGRGMRRKDDREEEEAYEDLLPVMAERLDAEEFVSELCAGFRLLAEPGRGLITPESLRRNGAALGMGGMTAEDAAAMVREGDLDGDGALDEREFCVLMVRLSPGMMADAEEWLAKAIQGNFTTPQKA